MITCERGTLYRKLGPRSSVPLDGTSNPRFVSC